jgi:aldehyde dehydrogenase (NAD+)
LKVFYTGNGRVGRIIAAAAAKHLTPITLELGGKSPVIIDPAYDINIAAKRILWGKINNAGQVSSLPLLVLFPLTVNLQICIAPDYVLIPRDKQVEFVAALTEHYHKFFPEGPLKSSSYSRIVSTVHHSRLMSLLARTKGTIALGGRVDDNKGFEPTVVRDVYDGDSLLEEYEHLLL